MLDMTPTIKAKSDQLNADDLIGGPITIKITKVSKGAADQPININYEGDSGKPFKPCKTVRRILVAAWGKDGTLYVGKSMTIYNDQSVLWGGKPVGGIRISHLSDIDGTSLDVSLAVTRGVKRTITVEKLQVATQTPPPAQETPPAASNIKLIKSDGSEKGFESFEVWYEFIKTNLPKITAIENLDTFEKSHQTLFAEYRETGFAEWVDKALAVIDENRTRLTKGEL